MFCGVKNSKLFDDIVRHGSHNIFWYDDLNVMLYNIKKITPSHKSNEIFYMSFYL